jgi:hypothetical protein
MGAGSPRGRGRRRGVWRAVHGAQGGRLFGASGTGPRRGTAEEPTVLGSMLQGRRHSDRGGGGGRVGPAPHNAIF